MRLIHGDDSETESQQSTADIFKDMLNQKKNMLLSKLTSFESDVKLFVCRILKFSYILIIVLG